MPFVSLIEDFNRKEGTLKASHKIRALHKLLLKSLIRLIQIFLFALPLRDTKRVVIFSFVCSAFSVPSLAKETRIGRATHYKQIFFVLLKDTSWYYLYPMLPFFFLG